MERTRVRVKLCGMTRLEDINHAIALGVDAVGLIFYPQSLRHVSIDEAKFLTKERPPFVDFVAVLVNPDKDFVQELLYELPVNCLQFHGDETPAFCEQFNRPYIKAIQADNLCQIQKAQSDFKNAQALLLDTPSLSNRGGTGLTFDWRVIPKERTRPLILSGGLNELNVSDAIKTTNPYAVDVCSGIESSPGVKDPIKMNQFIKTLWGL